MPFRPRSAAAALLSALLILTCAACADPDARPEPAEPSIPEAASPITTAGTPEPAPAFTAPTLDGDSLRLADLEGQVVVLNFWATWCAPCRTEIPGFIALQEELGGDGVQFVGIALDEDGADIVGPFAETFGITYPTVLDPDGDIAMAYGGTYSLPTTYLIDREGLVRQRLIGEVQPDELRPLLQALLDETAAGT